MKTICLVTKKDAKHALSPFRPTEIMIPRTKIFVFWNMLTNVFPLG